MVADSPTANQTSQERESSHIKRLWWKCINLGAGCVGAACLAITLVASGFVIDAYVPATVSILSKQFSDVQDSPFNQEELLVAAQATADYTVRSNNLQDLYNTLVDINKSAIEDGRAYEGSSLAPRVSDLNPDEKGNYPIDQVNISFSNASEQYILDASAISHLDDCYRVISKANIVLIFCLLLGIACVAHVYFRCSRKAFGATLAIPAGVVLAAFGTALLWLIVDFDGLFTAFHGLFFQAGTWEFSWDSLLICMYPLEFWTAMGCIWFGVTLALSIVCLCLGMRCLKEPRKELDHTVK